MNDTARAVERVFREEHGRVLSILISSLGDFDLAEDALQETFVTALERWPRDGLPDNPAAWMVTIPALLLLWAYQGIRYAVRRLGLHYRLTNQRFFHESGIFRRTTNRIEVIDMDDITFEQGFVDRFFGAPSDAASRAPASRR